MAKVEVFDPPMCCASGTCGPKVDKRLVEFGASLNWLRGQGVQVERHNPTQEYHAFVGNPAVVTAINEYGTACLPLILVDGEMVSRGDYPGRTELAAMAGVNAAKQGDEG